CANDAIDLTAHDHLLTRDHAGHLAPLADDDLGGLHISLDLAIDLQHAATDDLEPLANDLEVVADHRLLPARRGAEPVLCSAAIETGFAGLGPFGLGRRATHEHGSPS